MIPLAKDSAGYLTISSFVIPKTSGFIDTAQAKVLPPPLFLFILVRTLLTT